MNKVIITGVGGFIGGQLAAKLLSQNVTVIGIDISRQSLERFSNNKLFVPVVADFSKYNSLTDLIKEKDIDVFFHFAWAGGFTTALKDYELQLYNAIGSCKAYEASINLGCKKFILAGTVNEFEIVDHFLDNSLEFRNTCIYSSAKFASEMICKTLATNSDVEFFVGLIPMIYGAGNRSMQLINVVISQLITGTSPLLVEGNNLYDIVYIDDVVDAFCAIAEKGKSQSSYYIGHERLKTFKEWIISIRDIISPSIELKFGGYRDNLSINYSRYNLSLLKIDTGFECRTDFEETILNTADWISRNMIKTEEVNKNMLSKKMLAKLGESDYSRIEMGGGTSRKEINPISFQFIEAILDAFDAIRGEFYAA